MSVYDLYTVYMFALYIYTHKLTHGALIWISDNVHTVFTLSVCLFSSLEYLKSLRAVLFRQFLLLPSSSFAALPSYPLVLSLTSHGVLRTVQARSLPPTSSSARWQKTLWRCRGPNPRVPSVDSRSPTPTRRMVRTNVMFYSTFRFIGLFKVSFKIGVCRPQHVSKLTANCPHRWAGVGVRGQRRLHPRPDATLSWFNLRGQRYLHPRTGRERSNQRLCHDTWVLQSVLL